VGKDVTPFCPHCGAPQIYLSEYEEQTSVSAGETTGTLPPPRPRQIEWKTAIRCAALVAAVAAVLSLVSAKVQMVSPLTWLWTVSGSMITLALYQKRRPQAWMDAGIGARIGLVVGLTLMVGLACSAAIVGLVARFGLHSMAAFDVQLTQELHAEIVKAQAANPQSPEVLKFFATPEFRAGLMLSGFAMVSGFLLVLSTLGGALSGMLRTRRKLHV
jgi:hypothetical protein